MRQFIKGIDAAFGAGAGVRSLALHGQVGRADAAGGQRQARFSAAAFEREDGVLVGAQAGDRAAGTRRTDLFVAVDQHGDGAEIAEAQLLQQGQGRTPCRRPRGTAGLSACHCGIPCPCGRSA
ncbi:hypothetical protein G6F57_021283 [Rhizopus arrhizus]|nr:hypothetical protein G6F57_021283 [Rhizopus arrhizus]